MEKVGLIYSITNKKNKKTYIGQTIRPLQKRWYSHVYQSKHRSYPICNAIKKYGKENFFIDEIEKCKASELDEKEKFWIKYYNSISPNGYNLKKGGNTIRGKDSPWWNKKHSKKTKEKMSKSHIGEKNSNTDLKNKDVENIIFMIISNKTIKEIAKSFNISEDIVSQIKTGKTWKHITKNYTNLLDKKTKRKLKKEDVLSIRKLIKEGNDDKSISKIYNVSPRAIYNIRNNKTWKNIT